MNYSPTFVPPPRKTLQWKNKLQLFSIRQRKFPKNYKPIWLTQIFNYINKSILLLLSRMEEIISIKENNFNKRNCIWNFEMVKFLEIFTEIWHSYMAGFKILYWQQLIMNFYSRLKLDWMNSDNIEIDMFQFIKLCNRYLMNTIKDHMANLQSQNVVLQIYIDTLCKHNSSYKKKRKKPRI